MDVVGCLNGRVAGVVRQTTGIEVTSASLGANWPAAALIIQDNKTNEPQNYKYVRWDLIEDRLY